MKIYTENEIVISVAPEQAPIGDNIKEFEIEQFPVVAGVGWYSYAPETGLALTARGVEKIQSEYGLEPALYFECPFREKRITEKQWKACQSYQEQHIDANGITALIRKNTPKANECLAWVDTLTIEQAIDLHIPQVIGGLFVGGTAVWSWWRQKKKHEDKIHSIELQSIQVQKEELDAKVQQLLSEREMMKRKMNEKDLVNHDLLIDFDSARNTWKSTGLACQKRQFVYESICELWVNEMEAMCRDMQTNEELHKKPLADYRHTIRNTAHKHYCTIITGLNQKLPREIVTKIDKRLFGILLAHFKAIINSIASERSQYDNNFERSIGIITTLAGQINVLCETTTKTVIESLNGDITSRDLNDISCDDCKQPACAGMASIIRGRIK